MMHEERPFQTPQQVKQLLPVFAHAFLIALPQRFGAPGYHLFAGLGRCEFRAALIGKRFLGRVEHLNKVTAHALHGEAFQPWRQLLDGFKKI